MSSTPKLKSPKKRKSAPVHLKEGRKQQILKLLEQWQGPLKWEPFLDAVEQVTGHRYTRQALWNHERIRLLFIAQKNDIRHRVKKEKQQQGSEAVVAALEKRNRLQREVDHLKAVINNYDQLWERWAYNLRLKGFTDEDLHREADKALPAKPREQTEPLDEEAAPKIRRKRGTTGNKTNG